MNTFNVFLIVSTSINAIPANGNVGNTINSIRIVTSYNVLRSFLDLFLVYNMFLLLDGNKKVDIIRDERKNISYHLLDVVVKLKKPRMSTQISSDDSTSTLNESDEEEVKEAKDEINEEI